MIALVWRTDVHMADTPPQSRTDNWEQTLLGKLQQVNEIAKQEGAIAILDGGDFFHCKSPGQNSHAMLQAVTQITLDGPPVYATVGNHDVKYGDIRFLKEAPLGVLFEAQVFNRLYESHEAIFETGDFVGMDGPQMVNGSSGHINKLKVRVVGVPYHGVAYDRNRFSTITKGDEDWLVVVVHCAASPEGGKLFESEDILSYSELANLDPDIWLLAHWHKDQDIRQVGRKWFVNLGALSRGSIAQEELTRSPACGVLKFDKQRVDIRRVNLQVRPPLEVFDLEGRDRAETRATAIEAFVSSLATGFIKTGNIPLPQVVQGMFDVPAKVRERTVLYLERAHSR